MAIPTATLESHLIGAARWRAAELLQVFASASAVSEPVGALCDRAAAAIDQYCDGLLDALLTAVIPAGGDENEWVRRHYLPLVIEFATAMRDVMGDPTSRHAAAQTIQCKILEHERRLRTVLDSAAVSHPQVATTPDIRNGGDPAATQKPSAER